MTYVTCRMTEESLFDTPTPKQWSAFTLFSIVHTTTPGAQPVSNCGWYPRLLCRRLAAGLLGVWPHGLHRNNFTFCLFVGTVSGNAILVRAARKKAEEKPRPRFSIEWWGNVPRAIEGTRCEQINTFLCAAPVPCCICLLLSHAEAMEDAIHIQL